MERLFPKIKHETTCKDYKVGALKNVDISYKIASLQSLRCSWIRRLYNNNFHVWKLILQHLMTMSFGSKFKFHSNVFFLKKHHLKSFYRSTDIFLLIVRNIFLEVMKPQLALFHSFYGLTSIFK